MSLTAQFVDRIDAAATVRLDINDGPLFAITDADLSPPPLKRAIASTLLTDGDQIPAAAYGNRTLKLTVEINAADESALADQLTLLHRELNRPTNVLVWQSGSASKVFFRTFRAADYEHVLTTAEGFYQAVLSIPAEPFAYGLRVDVADATVSNDPAATFYLDVADVTGDVDTPAYVRLRQSAGSSTPSTFLVATRRHTSTFPAPGGALVEQAEAASSGTDTANAAANDGAMSGTGNNYKRTTFATDTGLIERVAFNSGPVGDLGTFRIYARHRRSSAAATVRGRIRVAPVSGGTVTTTLDTATHPAGTAGPYWVFYGLVQVPTGATPAEIGATGTAPNGWTDPGFLLDLQRAAGSGTVDTDLLMLVPADDDFAAFDVSQIAVNTSVSSGDTALALDGIQDLQYCVPTPGFPTYAVSSGPFRRTEGRLPSLAPGISNRLYIMDTTTGQSLAGGWTVSVSYWPRYLYIAP